MLLSLAEPAGQWNARKHDDDIEQDMRVDHLRDRVAAEEAERRLEAFKQHQHDHRTCTAHQQIAERDDASFGWRVAGQNWGNNGRAEIDTQHHDNCKLGRD